MSARVLPFRRGVSRAAWLEQQFREGDDSDDRIGQLLFDFGRPKRRDVTPNPEIVDAAWVMVCLGSVAIPELPARSRNRWVAKVTAWAGCAYHVAGCVLYYDGPTQ